MVIKLISDRTLPAVMGRGPEAVGGREALPFLDALELNVGGKIMKNDEKKTKSIEFCMKFVNNRPRNVISSPDTDLTFFVL